MPGTKNSSIIHAIIENRIFNLRGIQVMIDRDLAEMYGVLTKRLNEQVKRNIDRFPKQFCFQLTKIEKDELVANCDRFENLKDSHDRFLIVDDKDLYHIGASLKDLGKKWFAFSRLGVSLKDKLQLKEKQNQK